MNQSILTSKTGIKAQQIRLDVVGNNVANSNTIGYKSARVDFKDALYQTLRRPVQPQDELNLELGHGVIVSSTTRNFNTGAVQVTGNPTDVLLTGDGFFSVLSENGQVQYTRNGAFNISQEGEGVLYLINGRGEYILDTQGNPIRIQGRAEDITIGQDGAISDAGGAPYAYLAVYTFDNQKGLEAVGDSNFVPTEASGEAQTLSGSIMRQGALEMSNVDYAHEMTRLIRTQRAFQLSSRALTTADQMMGIAVNMRRA